MSIGERIRESRKKNKKTQEALAKATGLSQMSIRRYESGDRMPPADIAAKIADALEISLDYLMGVTTQTVNVYDPTTGETYENNVLIRFPKGHPMYVPTLQEVEAQKDELLEHFENLNDTGRDKTVEYAKDLTANPLYQRKKREK